MQWIRLILGFNLVLALSAQSLAEADNSPAPNASAPNTSVPNNGYMRLEVIDPYVEMHTGPGRGYPVFHVIEQGETVEVLTRRPDWYEIRSQQGKVGWTTAAQLSRTLQPTGVPVDLPTVSHGDYLKNSWHVGFTAGQFSNGDELEGSDNFGVSAGFRPLSWLGLDIEGGKTYDTDINGEFYGYSIVLEPFSRWRLSPFISAGQGKITLESQPKLVPLGIDQSDYDGYGVGLNYYLGRNFLIKGEYRWMDVSADEQTVKLQEWKLGFSTFF
jgi:opacity protein-like surface antigen